MYTIAHAHQMKTSLFFSKKLKDSFIYSTKNNFTRKSGRLAFVRLDSWILREYPCIILVLNLLLTNILYYKCIHMAADGVKFLSLN